MLNRRKELAAVRVAERVVEQASAYLLIRRYILARLLEGKLGVITGANGRGGLRQKSFHCLSESVLLARFHCGGNSCIFIVLSAPVQ
jgi:hypothetical protein